jgi:hypothetical protein
MRSVQTQTSNLLFGLPKKSHGRIPGAIIPVHKPPPNRDVFQGKENRPSQCPGKMGDRGIGSDDEIDIFHHRRAIQERVYSRIKIISETLDRKLSPCCFYLERILILHETDQTDAANCREWREALQWDRPLEVDEFIALPANTYAKAVIAESRGPF